MVPISKPPTQRRDPLYLLSFLFVFLLLIILSAVIKRDPLEESVIPAAFAGNWASMIMIAPLLATFSGVGLFLTLAFHQTFREIFFKYSSTLSILTKVCLANILLLGTDHWFLGATVLVSLIWDSLRSQECQDNLTSDLTMMELIESISEPFDTLLLSTGLALVIVNMFLLLWCGVITIYILSELSTIHGILLLPLLLFILFWISSFMHDYLASMIGGCMFWTFHRPQGTLYDTDTHRSQLFLYLQISSGPCVGSLCKSSLLCPLFQSILSLTSVLEWKVSTSPSSFSPLRCIMTSITPPLLNLYHSSGLEPISREFHRLAPLYIATYGQTHHTASHLIHRKHPHLIDMVSIDTLAYRLHLLTNWVSISLSLLLVAMASIETQEMKEIWLTFFLFCYLLCHFCISLSLYALTVACDAMYLAAYDYPDIFLEKSPILFHRLERINEIELS
jgi:hypothetical protein